MNKEKAETSLENYQALFELYGNMRKELARTRKALDVAKEALNDIQFTDDGNQIVDIRSFAHHAFDQIKTVLEQKDK